MGTNDVARFIPFDLWFDYHNPVGWSSFPVRIAYPVNGMGGSVVSQFARGTACPPWRDTIAYPDDGRACANAWLPQNTPATEDWSPFKSIRANGPTAGRTGSHAVGEGEALQFPSDLGRFAVAAYVIETPEPAVPSAA